MEEIEINLIELYNLSEKPPQESAYTLLKKILEYYNIEPKFIIDYADFIELYENEKAKIITENEANELLSKCNRIVVLYDGYEVAKACI